MRSHAMISAAFVLVTTVWIESVTAKEPERVRHPNILWISVEDMSPTLGCYGDAQAKTPHIDALATQSIKYSHAFATSPVCSPSRACIIQGCPATSLGNHPMRSSLPLPESMTGFPTELRKLGYFTSNNVKTDYNTSAADRIIEHSWDQCSETAHWRDRKKDQPFFSVFNLMTTHQSRTMVWPYEQFQSEIQSRLSAEQITNPDSVELPPYYPETDQVKKTVARFYDCVAAMDGEVGDLLNQLEQDGLAEDTIVFFFSDHGSGMPRHKRALLDSGMRIPLLVRVPVKFRNLATRAPGQWTDRLVNFADFAPTVLSLAGVSQTPAWMTGRSFLGSNVADSPEFLFGHRDRVDEIMDKARCVRSKRYLYIRNFMPHLGYNQQNAWCDQAAIREDFYALAKAGTATPAQDQYLRSSRPVEELYDCQIDPLNLNNLAENPQSKAILAKMREVLRTHLSESRDLGLIPETELNRISENETPYLWARTNQFAHEEIIDAAYLVGEQDQASIGKALQHPDPAVRYWGAVACRSSEPWGPSLTERLTERLNDTCAAVQIESAAALIDHGQVKQAYPALIQRLSDSDLATVLYSVRTLELTADPAHQQTMTELFQRYQNQPGDMAWFIRFSISGYLKRLPEPILVTP